MSSSVATATAAKEFNTLWRPGKLMVMLSYSRDLTGPLTNRNVLLRLMDLQTKKVWTVDEITGGGGTINVPSWAPDSKRFAFVAYQQLLTEDADGK